MKSAVLLHTLMWKHFDGIKNLFLYPLHNRNLRNFLDDHMFLHSWIFNSVLDRHPWNDLFPMDLAVHKRIKFILRNDLWRKSLNSRKGKLRVHQIGSVEVDVSSDCCRGVDRR